MKNKRLNKEHPQIGNVSKKRSSDHAKLKPSAKKNKGKVM